MCAPVRGAGGAADRRAVEMTGVGVVVWWVARESAGGGYRALTPSSVHFSYYVNNRQPIITEAAIETCSPQACSSGGERVVGDGETQWKEHEREGDQKETRHRVLACVPSEYR